MDTKQIQEMTGLLNEATAGVKEFKQQQEERVQRLEQSINDLYAYQKHPGAGAGGESKAYQGDPQLKSFFNKGELPAETKEISVAADGQNVTVRSQWSDRIFSLIRESSPVRQVANVMQTNSNELEVLIDRGDAGSDWVGELDARAKTTAEYLTRQRIAVHEHYSNPEITLHMIEDSQFDVEAWLQQKVRNRFARQEAAAFIGGDGIGKPRGLLDYGTVKEADFVWGADPDLYTIGATYSGVDGDLTDPDVLMDLVDSLKAPYLPGAGWMMTRAFRNIVRKLKDTQDRYLFEASLQSGVPDRLLGYPVYLAEDMDAPAADTVGALFGDFGQAYTIVDRTGITVQRDAVTQPGWVRYFTRRRVGGALTNPEAVKALVLGTEPA